MKRISVDLSDGLYERLRYAAYLSDRPLTEEIRDQLGSSLPEVPEAPEDHQPRARARRRSAGRT